MAETGARRRELGRGRDRDRKASKERLRARARAVRGCRNGRSAAWSTQGRDRRVPARTWVMSRSGQIEQRRRDEGGGHALMMAEVSFPMRPPGGAFRTAGAPVDATEPSSPRSGRGKRPWRIPATIWFRCSGRLVYGWVTIPVARRRASRREGGSMRTTVHDLLQQEEGTRRHFGDARVLGVRGARRPSPSGTSARCWCSKANAWSASFRSATTRSPGDPQGQKASKDTPVREIMTTSVVCVHPEQTIEGVHGAHDRQAFPPPSGPRRRSPPRGALDRRRRESPPLDEQQFRIEQLEGYISSGG